MYSQRCFQTENRTFFFLLNQTTLHRIQTELQLVYHVLQLNHDHEL